MVELESARRLLEGSTKREDGRGTVAMPDFSLLKLAFSRGPRKDGHSTRAWAWLSISTMKDREGAGSNRNVAAPRRALADNSAGALVAARPRHSTTSCVHAGDPHTLEHQNLSFFAHMTHTGYSICRPVGRRRTRPRSGVGQRQRDGTLTSTGHIRSLQ